MKKLFLSAIGMLLLVQAYATRMDTVLTVHFTTNSAVLSSESKNLLDQVVRQAREAGHYELKLTAHTDQVGNRSYNQALSERREASVKQYLLGAGLEAELISGSAHGESIPAEALPDETESRLNRRVEIRLSLVHFSSVDEILQTARGQCTQQFLLSGNEAQEIRGEQGTCLIIPSDAFETADGKPVPNGEVVFELEEYPGFKEGFLNRLSTLAGGELLETGGMLKITARYQGQELQLRKGKEIPVRMPSTNMQEGMTVFTGYTTPNGVVEWTDTRAPFQQVDPNIRPKLPLPGLPEKLLAMVVPVPPMPRVSHADWSFDIPQFPLRPHPPRKPEAPIEPELQTGQSSGGVFHWFSREAREERKSMEKYRKDLALYHKRMLQYEKYMVRYEARMEQFRIDSAAHAQQYKAYLDGLDQQLLRMETLITSLTARYDAIRWNASLRSLAKSINDSVYYESDLEVRLLMGAAMKMISPEIEYLGKALNDKYWLEIIRNNEPGEIKQYRSKGRFNWRVMQTALRTGKLSGKMYFPWQHYHYPNLLSRELADRPENAEVFEQARARIRDLKIKLNIFSNSDLPNIYSGAITSMGLTNCDRLADFPKNQLARLDISNLDIANTTVFLPDRNCMIPLGSWVSYKKEVELPVDERVTLVTVRARDGKAEIGIQRIKTLKRDTPVNVIMQSVSISKMMNLLDSIESL